MPNITWTILKHEIKKIFQKNKWKKFNEFDMDTFPKNHNVLVTNGKYVVQAQFYCKNSQGIFNDGTGKVDNVTHWMYLESITNS